MEWQEQQAHNAYPFIEDSGPLASDGRPLSDAFADLSVFTDATNVVLTSMSDPAVEPVSIAFTADDGFTYSAADGVVEVFGVWTVVRWQKASVLIDTARAALHTWPVSVSMPVVVNALGVSNPNVTKLSIAVGTALSFDVEDSEVLEIEDGYNCGLSYADTTDVRKTNQITIDVGAGLGKGRFSPCQTEPILTKINSTPAVYGKFNMQGQDCTFINASRGEEILPSVWEIEQGQLIVVDNCQPCCSCDDYVDVYKDVLTPIYDNAKEASDKLYQAIANYENARQRFEDEKLCREGLVVSVYLSARPGWYIQAQLVIRNNTDCDTEVFEVALTQTLGSVLTPKESVRIYRAGEITNIDATIDDRSVTVSAIDPLRAAEQLHVNITYYADEASGRAEGGIIGMVGTFFDGTTIADAEASTEFVGPFNR